MFAVYPDGIMEKGGRLMDNWYSIYEIGRSRHHELERKYGNPHRIAAYHLKREAARAKRRQLYRRTMAAFGRILETWGQELQKKFQTC